MNIFYSTDTLSGKFSQSLPHRLQRFSNRSDAKLFSYNAIVNYDTFVPSLLHFVNRPSCFVLCLLSRHKCFAFAAVRNQSARKYVLYYATSLFYPMRQGKSAEERYWGRGASERKEIHRTKAECLENRNIPVV